MHNVHTTVRSLAQLNREFWRDENRDNLEKVLGYKTRSQDWNLTIKSFEFQAKKFRHCICL